MPVKQSCMMNATQLELRSYVKIAVLHERNVGECHTELVEALGNDVLPYQNLTVARWAAAFWCGRRSNCRHAMSRTTYDCA